MLTAKNKEFYLGPQPTKGGEGQKLVQKKKKINGKKSRTNCLNYNGKAGSPWTSR